MKSSKHECGPSIAAVELTQVESWSAYLPRDSTRALSRTNWIYRFQPVFRLSLYGADSNLRFFFRRRRLAFLANASSPFELFPKLFIALLAFTFCTGCIFVEIISFVANLVSSNKRLTEAAERQSSECGTLITRTRGNSIRKPFFGNK